MNSIQGSLINSEHLHDSVYRVNCTLYNVHVCTRTHSFMFDSVNLDKKANYYKIGSVKSNFLTNARSTD